MPLAERQRSGPSKPARWVRLPEGTLGDRLTVGYLALNEAVKVRVLLPELASPHPTLSREGRGDQMALVVKRTSRDASNVEVRVRLLAGALMACVGRVRESPGVCKAPVTD